LSDVSSVDGLYNLGREEELKQPIEDIFWAHCSNIQAWVENNYNTNLLHSNLSFPLLKLLSQEGDLYAKRVFKDEIARRFQQGNESINSYLFMEGYLNYLTEQELYSLLNPLESDFLYDFSKKTKIKLYQTDCNDGLGFILKGTAIDALYINCAGLTKLPNSIGNLSNLRELHLVDNNLKTLPSTIGKLESLRELQLGFNNLSILPDSFKKLKSLQILGLNNNMFRIFPGSLRFLTSLRELHIENNNLNNIPQFIHSLKLDYISLFPQNP
jgi:Leucine-rich repeat (LRR) protein